MGSSIEKKRNHLGVACGIATLVLASAAADAAEWRITPRVSLEETYTSNVRLERKGEEDSDLITRLSPGISVRGTGPSLRVGLDYDPDILFYLTADEQNGIRNNLAGFANADFFERRLGIDANASIVQAFTNPAGGISGSDSLIGGTIPTTTGSTAASNNLSEVKTFTVSPFWRERIGGVVESELRYRFGIVAADTSDVGDTITNAVSASLRGAPGATGRLGWSVSGHQEWTETSGGRSGIGGTGGVELGDTSRRRRLARADLSYQVFSNFALLAGTGWEEIDDPTLREEPDGLIWNVGFEYRPRPRSSFRLTYGRRFDDQDLEIASQWQLGATTRLSLSFTESLETSQSSLLEQTTQIGIDAQGNLIDLATGLPFQPGERELGLTSQTFRQESFRAALVSQRGRNSFSVLVNYQNRKAESPSTDKERTAGAGLGWQRRLSPTLSLDTQLDYRNLRFGGSISGRDDIYTAGAGLSFNLSDTVLLHLRLRHTERQSTEDLRELRETLVSVRLSKSF